MTGDWRRMLVGLVAVLVAVVPGEAIAASAGKKARPSDASSRGGTRYWRPKGLPKSVPSTGGELVSPAACVPDGYEPDDDSGQAKPLVVGMCEDHNHCDDAFDWSVLDLVAGSTYTIQTCNTGTTSDTVIRLYDPALRLLNDDDDGGVCDPRASALVVVAPATGTYYLEKGQVGDIAGDGREYRVCLSAGCTIGDPFEEDDTSGSAAPIALAECQDHDHCEDGTDWLTFPATAGASYQVETCNRGLKSNTRVRVYDPSLVLLGEDDDTGPCDPGASLVVFRATQTGPHFIEVVQSDGGSGAERGYTVCLRPGCGSADAYEEDDSPAQAKPIAVGECQMHDHCEDAHDWLSVAVTPGRAYTVSTCNTGTASDTSLRLYDASLSPLLSDDDGGACDPLAAEISFTADVAATWLLDVGEYVDEFGPDRAYQVCLAAAARTARLLRNTAVTQLRPMTPPRAVILPLDPVSDLYLATFAPGSPEPDGQALVGRSPLIFYAIDGPETLKMRKVSNRLQLLF